MSKEVQTAEVPAVFTFELNGDIEIPARVFDGDLPTPHVIAVTLWAVYDLRQFHIVLGFRAFSFSRSQTVCDTLILISSWHRLHVW